MKNKKKSMSFTKFQQTCPDHKQNDAKVCYCDAVSGERLKNCNLINCPIYGQAIEE